MEKLCRAKPRMAEGSTGLGGTTGTPAQTDLFTQPALITNLVFPDEYFKGRELCRLLV